MNEIGRHVSIRSDDDLDRTHAAIPVQAAKHFMARIDDEIALFQRMIDPDKLRTV